jgi:hypothetical protein
MEKKKEICNRVGCGKEIGFVFLNTALGKFCSEECRAKIEDTVFKILVDLPVPPTQL